MTRLRCQSVVAHADNLLSISPTPPEQWDFVTLPFSGLMSFRSFHKTDPSSTALKTPPNPNDRFGTKTTPSHAGSTPAQDVLAFRFFSSKPMADGTFADASICSSSARFSTELERTCAVKKLVLKHRPPGNQGWVFVQLTYQTLLSSSFQGVTSHHACRTAMPCKAPLEADWPVNSSITTTLILKDRLNEVARFRYLTDTSHTFLTCAARLKTPSLNYFCRMTPPVTLL